MDFDVECPRRVEAALHGLEGGAWRWKLSFLRA